ncbi:MAG: hypothetical protein AAFQ88_13845 [Pseudomonadota bacterium]
MIVARLATALCLAVALLPLELRAQPATAELSVWLQESSWGARIQAFVGQTTANPPPVITNQNDRQAFARMVATTMPAEAIIDDIAASMARRLAPETIEVIQRFTATGVGVRISRRFRQLSLQMITEEGQAAVLESGRRALEADRLVGSARTDDYARMVGDPGLLELEIAGALALQHALWAPLVAAGMTGEPMEPAAYRAWLEADRERMETAYVADLTLIYAHAFKPFSDGILGWAADISDSAEGRRFAEAYLKAETAALLPRALALGEQMAERFAGEEH